MDLLQQSIEVQIFNNPVKAYYYAFGFIVIVLTVFHFLRSQCLHRLESLSRKTKSSVDDILIAMLKNVPKVFFVALIFLVAVRMFLRFPTDFTHLLDAILLILIVFQVVRLAINGGLEVMKQTRLGKNKTTFQGISLIIQIIAWSIAFLVVLSNLGFDITALATSLGIGGIAIALAVQNILGDLFASFTIYFDKPFEVGDWIELGDKGGTVEKIGLKTTRIRTRYGDQLVVSNRQLTESKIQNYKVRYRQKTFRFVLPLETDPDTLEQIDPLVQKVCEKDPDWSVAWCRLVNIIDYGYEFEASIHFDYPGWEDYLREQEGFYIEFVREMNAQGIALAYPTRKVVRGEIN